MNTERKRNRVNEQNTHIHIMLMTHTVAERKLLMPIVPIIN